MRLARGLAPLACCAVDKPMHKEGRKYYICSSRLGLIRWDIIQHVKAVHDKMSNTSDVCLPHELHDKSVLYDNQTKYWGAPQASLAYSRTAVVFLNRQGTPR